MIHYKTIHLRDKKINTNSNLLAITPLHKLHQELGAKLVTFSGYEMPLQFPTGIIAEHMHTRNSAGLFDISHMGQIKITGKNAALSLEKLVPSDILSLQPSQQCYTLFTNQEGGVLDDLIVINLDTSYLLIVNAACKQADFDHLQQLLSNQCNIEVLSEQALLALQGPKAREVLARIFPTVEFLQFMNVLQTEFKSVPCFITCSGYTGEDGFEISIPAELAEDLARMLLKQKEVLPIGLGARDSLRLEAGLCLYGHDLTTETSLIEAGLTWVVSKSRRPKGERAGGYLGAERITKQIVNGVEKLRIGMLPEGKAPIREGTMLFNDKDQYIGNVTSGNYSPSLKRPIAMGYVLSSHVELGTQIYANIRDKRIPLTITKLPFKQANYYK